METSNGRDNPNRYRVYDSKGIGPCLGTCGCGGLEPHIIQPFGIDKSCNSPRKIDTANCLTARENRGVANWT